MNAATKSKRRIISRSIGAGLGVAVLLGVSACGSSTSESSANSTPTGTETTTEVTSQEPAPDETGVAEVEAAIEAIEVPEGPEPGTDAALAWDALMSPVGEYAAAASYAAVIDEFGPVEPYVSIKAGEERHIAALIRQLDGFGIQAPDNPYLGKVPAPASLESAAQAWATGEVDNVDLYDELLAATDDSRLTRVFTNLRRASLESHLPLFEAAAENGGSLTEEQIAELGHGDHEGGQGGGQGGGHGQGGGKGMGNGQRHNQDA